MLLVVSGHLLTGSFVPNWYSVTVRDFIYSFHMALFFFISGFLAGYSLRPIHSLEDYWGYIGKKFKKFFIPFIVFGFVCLALSLYHQGYSAEKLCSGIINLFIAPRASHSGYLWYIYLLFVFYCLLPCFFRKEPWSEIFFACVALWLVIFPIPTNIFSLDHFSHFFFFFLLGTIGARHFDVVRKIRPMIFIAGVCTFILWGFYIAFLGCAPYHFGAGLLSIPVCAALACFVQRFQFISKVLTQISVNCFWIYLMHLFVIQLCAATVDRLRFPMEKYFAPYAICVICLATAVPIWMRKLYLSHMDIKGRN